MLIMCVLFMKHSSLPNKTFGFVHRRQEQNVMPMTKWVYNHNHTTATATLMPTTMLAERNETYALYIIYTCIFRIEFPSPFHICFMLFFPLVSFILAILRIKFINMLNIYPWAYFIRSLCYISIAICMRVALVVVLCRYVEWNRIALWLWPCHLWIQCSAQVNKCNKKVFATISRKYYFLLNYTSN